MPDDPRQAAPCPHCGAATERTQGVCADCGALLGGAWPPPPGGQAPLPPPLPRTLTGRAWGDFGLGAAGQYLTHLGTAQLLARFMATTAPIGPHGDWVTRATVTGGFVLAEMSGAVLLGLAVYYGARRFSPALARGSGYATLALLAVLLGAFFTCRPLLY